MTQSTSPSFAVQAELLTDRYTYISRALHAIAKTPREYELMVALIEYRWYPTSPIIPSVKTLSETIRCSVRTVRRTLEALEARGLVLREERRAADRRQMSNHIHLCGDLLAAVTAVEAATGRAQDQPWQGSRSNVAVKTKEQNYPNGNRQSKGRYTPPTMSGSLLETRQGLYVRRE